MMGVDAEPRAIAVRGRMAMGQTRELLLETLPNAAEIQGLPFLTFQF